MKTQIMDRLKIPLTPVRLVEVTLTPVHSKKTISYYFKRGIMFSWISIEAILKSR